MSLTKSKIIKILFSSLLAIAMISWFLLADVGEAFEETAESFQIPTQLIKTIRTDTDIYTLNSSPGSSFTSGETWVKKNGQMLYSLNTQEGRIDDINIVNGRLQLSGPGVETLLQ